MKWHIGRINALQRASFLPARRSLFNRAIFENSPFHPFTSAFKSQFESWAPVLADSSRFAQRLLTCITSDWGALPWIYSVCFEKETRIQCVFVCVCVCAPCVSLETGLHYKTWRRYTLSGTHRCTTSRRGFLVCVCVVCPTTVLNKLPRLILLSGVGEEEKERAAWREHEINVGIQWLDPNMDLPHCFLHMPTKRTHRISGATGF